MRTDSQDLSERIDSTFATWREVRAAYRPELTAVATGIVQSTASGIAMVSGLPEVGYEELVRFQGGLYGLTFDIDEEQVACVLLGESDDLQAGSEAERTGRVADIPVGEEMLGRVIDPTARPLDGLGPIRACKRMPIECDSPQIMDRAPVNVPMQTGIKVIDALIPIGRGQRELILGDRQTGKTSIAIDAIINQTGSGMICVYCAIGQRSASVARVIADLKATGAMDHTVVVVAEGNNAPGLRYITPYAATTLGEYFMRQGRDVLIVYDDLTHHARAYRELSLLLRRPPGREAFPGDIFYVHSRLLERATHLRPELGGGSLTALPIIETEAQNMAAYIPTNLISITDGQLYLSPDLFQKGILPAVDVGKSVSRVGGKAQLGAFRTVAGSLKLSYAQFEELEAFSRFGTRLDEQTRQNLEHGRRIRACLKQPQSAPIPVPEQITVLLALTTGLFNTVPVDRMPDAEQAVRKAAAEMPEDLRKRTLSGNEPTPADQDALLDLARKALATISEDQP